ncbi:hypothetical protein GCM10022225_77380 [Plantactinospora mayteni]|uniref:Uncharacterized protein n=1 Tax=Plantactinospora mayteni TaxID=566021 RepID=A0ABQ4F2M9_9ACTN|nr:hypothetical protein [Plantactinospora mayteni]GIH01171.1 hypothetical protein Pma05_77430 [Plantactinospora mayteni]
MERASDGDQIFLGRVIWKRPSNPQVDGSFRIVVLDKRTRRVPGYINVTSPRHDDVGAGSDGTLNRAEERYPWLEGIGARRVHGGFVTTASAITVSSIDASPVAFVLVLRPERPGTPPERAVVSAPTTVSDLLVALIGVGRTARSTGPSACCTDGPPYGRETATIVWRVVGGARLRRGRR